jgi:hypothetical protein
MAKKKDSNTELSQNLRQLPVEVEAKACGEVAIYNPDDSIRLEVRLENETVWLNRAQISLLFDRDVKTIGKHINSALGRFTLKSNGKNNRECHPSSREASIKTVRTGFLDTLSAIG